MAAGGRARKFMPRRGDSLAASVVVSRPPFAHSSSSAPAITAAHRLALKYAMFSRAAAVRRLPHAVSSANVRGVVSGGVATYDKTIEYVRRRRSGARCEAGTLLAAPVVKAHSTENVSSADWSKRVEL